MNADAQNTVEYRDCMLHVRMAKHQTGSELVRLKSQIVKTAGEKGEDIDVLVDVSEVETSDEHANQVAKTFFEGLPFRRMAVFGGSAAVNIGIRLVLNLFISRGVGEVRIIASEEKARQWIIDGK